MKLLSFTILFIAIVALMVYSNPTMKDYTSYVREVMIQEAGSEDEATQGLVLAFGGIAEYLIANATIRTNYLLLSIYRTEIGSERMSCIGLLGNFVACEGLVNEDSTQ